MKTVYGISTGEYSDYRVVAVCPDETVAERLADLWSIAEKGAWGSGYRVEELPVYESVKGAEPLVVYATNGKGGFWTFQILPHETDRVTPGTSLVSPEQALKSYHDALARRKAEEEGIA